MDETPLRVSPRARRVAQELGVTLSELTALGKSTIREEDVRALFSQRSAPAAVAAPPGSPDGAPMPLPPVDDAAPAPHVAPPPPTTGDGSPTTGDETAAVDTLPGVEAPRPAAAGEAPGGVEEPPVVGEAPAEAAPPPSEAEATAPDDFAALAERTPEMPLPGSAAITEQVPAAAEARLEETLPITPIRRIIADRALLSAREVPAFSFWIDVDVAAVLAKAGGEPLRATAVWVWAVAQALRAHRRVNASYTPEGIRLHATIHVGVTLPLEDGIVVPVLHDADHKSVEELTEELRDREERARSRRLRGEQLAGATFTLSDWSTFGIRGGVPLIHPPQSATLGIGAARDVPLPADGDLLFRSMSEVVLVADQRALDAAHAAAFLSALKREVEGITG